MKSYAFLTVILIFTASNFVYAQTLSGSSPGDSSEYGKANGQITAYNFSDTFMAAADTVSGNKADPRKKIALTIPVFNWEWDMELFSTLPYRYAGQKFMIVFLDPSGGEPAYYPYNVVVLDR